MMRLDIRVSVEDVAADVTPDKVRDALQEAVGLAGDAPFRALNDDHDAVRTYDEVVKDVIEAAIPGVRELLLAQFDKRLPFEWAEGAWDGPEPGASGQ